MFEVSFPPNGPRTNALMMVNGVNEISVTTWNSTTVLIN